MKKIIVALIISALPFFISGCATACCDDGRGHCCQTIDRTCPYTGYNAWWY